MRAPGVTASMSHRPCSGVPSRAAKHAAESNRGYFESRGIRLASADRWISGDNIYSTGWALGRLKFFPGSEINAAFTDGRLLPQDILLTDGVPAEIPVLAGVLTLTPSTPNSHVAILSKSFGLPFGYTTDPLLRDRVLQLVGKDVLVRMENSFFSEIQVTELDSSMDPALREEILRLKAPPTLKIVEKVKYGGVSAPTGNFTPAMPDLSTHSSLIETSVTRATSSRISKCTKRFEKASLLTALPTIFIAPFITMAITLH
jgi:hypothetical protein